MTDISLEQGIPPIEGIKRIDLLLEQSFQSRLENPEKAELLAKEALELSISLEDIDRQIKSHFHLADAYYSMGAFGNWKEAITASKRILEEHPEDELNNWLKFCEGQQLFLEGAIEPSLELFLELEAKFQLIQANSVLHIRTYLGLKVYLGLCWLKVNNPMAALNCFHSGYSYFTSLSSQLTAKQLRWPTYLTSCAHMALGQYEQARAWLKDELNENKNSELDDDLAHVTLLIALCYVEEQDWENALSSLEETQNVYKKHDHKNLAHWLYWYEYSAITLRHLGKLDQAFEHIKQAIEFHNKIRLALSEEELLLEMGLIQFAMNYTKEALETLNQVLNLVGENGNKKIAGEVHQALGKIYFAQEDFKQAYIHSNLGRVIEQDLWKNSNAIAVAAVELKHKYAQKLKDAEIYRLRNVELAQKNQELASINIQKDRLLEDRRKLMHIVIHDLRNPISVISLHSQLLIRLNVQTNDEKSIARLHIIEGAAVKMANLLDQWLGSDGLRGGDFDIFPKDGE